jgi:hypothetical protein
MNNCRACGNEFEPVFKYDKFCSQRCAADFEKVLQKVRATNSSIKKEAVPEPSFNFELVLKKKGKYTIENTQLEEIYDSTRQKAKFELLLASQNLKVIKGNMFSVIKKVV